MICESCLNAAIEDGADDEIAEEICRDYGADMADHICEQGKCACACKRHRR